MPRSARHHRAMDPLYEERKGWNVTHPYKAEVERSADALSPSEASRTLYAWLNENCGTSPTGKVEDAPYIVATGSYGATYRNMVLFREEIHAIQFKLAFSS